MEMNHLDILKLPPNKIIPPREKKRKLNKRKQNWRNFIKEERNQTIDIINSTEVLRKIGIPYLSPKHFCYKDICYFIVSLFLYLSVTPCCCQVRPLFAFRTVLILCGTHSTRSWKLFLEILVHIDTIAPSSRCTSMIIIPVPPHAKGVLLNWDLLTTEAIYLILNITKTKDSSRFPKIQASSPASEGLWGGHWGDTKIDNKVDEFQNTDRLFKNGQLPLFVKETNISWHLSNLLQM